MTWPQDRLSLFNDALALSGDNAINVANDGSDEWRVCSAAYEQAIEPMLESHNWPWATTVVTLASTGVAPSDDQFTTAFAKPADCAHIIWVRFADQALPYQILNNQIVVNSTGLSGALTMKYVSRNNQDPANGQVTPLFVAALLKFIQAGIFSGLHEDVQTGRAYEADGKSLLELAKSRADQEQPKRAMFNSRMRMARRVRRPWPTSPVGWGNTGLPN